MVIMNSTYQSDFFQVGATLDADAPSYVTREGDHQLYGALKKGEFCYVLNSRQMGKSSLATRVQDRLESEDIVTAYIDLQDIGETKEEGVWYNGLITELADELEDYLTIDWTYLLSSETKLSPSQKLGQFLDKVVLASEEIQDAGLVIFVDEIDFVKKLPFSTDSFFTLIRSICLSRSRKDKFKAVTFCFLGVATPSDLIAEKNITPFNVGEAIALKGFTLEEAQLLIRGLENRVDNPQGMMKNILDWTGGQPFFTQRVCDLVVSPNYSNSDLETLIQAQIIEGWQDQEKDKKGHFKNIKDRILDNEQKVGVLLELYREILTQGQINVRDTEEEEELRLSGLVVKRGNIIKVYNPIYERVFAESWIDDELRKLRPYAENFRAWMASDKAESSWLLRGKALEEAEEWAKDKNLSGDDRDFISASRTLEREEEIAQKEKEAELERERQAKEAAEEAKKVLKKANDEGKKRLGRRTFFGTVVLAVALIMAGFFAIQANNKKRQLKEIEVNIKVVKNLSDLAGELQNKRKSVPYNDALVQAGLSFNYDNSQLKRALLWSSISLAHQHLEQWHKAKEALTKSLMFVESNENNLFTSTEGIPIAFFTYSVQGNLLEECNLQKECQLLGEMKNSSSQSAYKKAVEYLLTTLPNDSTQKISEMIVQGEISSAYYLLNDSLTNDQQEDLRNLVQASLKKHYDFRTKQLIQQLEDLLKQEDLSQKKDWKKADGITWSAILTSAYSKNVDGFFYNNISCSHLKTIDDLWTSHSNGKYGFSVQKKIWKNLGSPTINSPEKEWINFYIRVGWKTEESGINSNEGYVNYQELGGYKDYKSSKKANIPRLWAGGHGAVRLLTLGVWRGSQIAKVCKL